MTKLRSIVEEEDDDPPGKVSIRREGVKVACAQLTRTTEKEKKKKIRQLGQGKGGFLSRRALG